MGTHLEQFSDFISLISDLRYVVIRGHHTLPKTPEGDIDMVVHPEDAGKVFAAANELLQLEREEDHGFGEYAPMLSKAYCTVGEVDPEIEHRNRRIKCLTRWKRFAD